MSQSHSGQPLQNFLVNLSKNPAARNAFRLDPPGVMAAAGLSQDHIIAVLSQDPAKIQEAIGGDPEALKPRLRVTVIIEIEF